MIVILLLLAISNKLKKLKTKVGREVMSSFKVKVKVFGSKVKVLKLKLKLLM